jgi:hypothetical protein
MTFGKVETCLRSGANEPPGAVLRLEVEDRDADVGHDAVRVRRASITTDSTVIAG